MSNEKETSTRYIGTCAACGRSIKVRDGKLVHHGYERPGHGYIEGDCFGVHYEPHETSPQCAIDLKPIIEAHIESQKVAIKNVESATSLIDWRKVTLTREENKYAFEAEQKSRIRQIERRIEKLTADRDRLASMVESWTAQPLTTVEEEKAFKRAVQEEKRAERAAARAKKEAEKRARREKREANRLARIKKARAIFDKEASKAENATQFAVALSNGFQRVEKATGSVSMSPMEQAVALGVEELFAKAGIEVWYEHGFYRAINMLAEVKFPRAS